MTTVTDNVGWAAARPRLSVLTPFFRDDPAALLAALATEAEAAAIGGAVELVLLDDGSGDDGLAEWVSAAVQALLLPARFVRLATNEGRAKGRNRLAENARGEWLLFLDSDMRPDAPDFLRRWLQLIDDERPAVAFGGFTVEAAGGRSFALHRRMAGRSDCLPAVERAKQPEKHVFTSNLLVRRDVFAAEPFDRSFVGWGWEDVEWAMRVGRRWPITHLDNPAVHLGLDRAETLATKFEQSAANFARVAKLHPDIVEAYPSYRVAKLLRRTPGRGLWRPWLRWAGVADLLPLAIRELAMRLYRASLYAEVVR